MEDLINETAFKERLSEALAQKAHEIQAIRMAHEQQTGDLQAEIKELRHTFDLRWKADIRAIKRWQESTGETLVWPDHADLCVWLLGELKKKTKSKP